MNYLFIMPKTKHFFFFFEINLTFITHDKYILYKGKCMQMILHIISNV